MTRRGVVLAGCVLAVVGAIVWALGLAAAPREAWLAYLAAVVAVLTVVLGAASLVLMAHLTDASWFVVLRRLAEAVAGAVIVVVLLLAPLAFGLSSLYPWLAPATLSPEVRDVVARQHAYLNLPFFAVRAGVYVAAWIAIVGGLRRWSARQDAGARPAPPVGFAAAAAIVLGFTLTFASFDWLMSLQPAWSSTIYGVRVFAGAIVAALALMAVLMRRSGLPVAGGNAQALASLLLSFVIFWFYIAFAQLLIVWIGNEPREIAWYLPRGRGGWFAAGVLLLIGHFVLPFLVLLYRSVKRSPDALARLGVWLLAMHYLDVAWLVFPGMGTSSAVLWMYAAAIALTGGATAAGAAWWLGDRAPVPESDPDLAVSLHYEYEDA